MNTREKNRKNLLRGLSLDDYIERYNPFGFKDETGDICVFMTYYDAYLELLRRLKKQFPRGYIDMCVFLCDNCAMELADAESEVRSWERRYHFFNPALVNWNDIDKVSESELSKIAQSMHFVSETPFKADQFKLALKDLVFN